ncbi:adenylate/guanylate cyclase domain-containing protein [Actinokineospora spheciospongiae]|uniref:adenylate/guanylate cyclase domain-containing protein n=1 Tax=Actinokineospora spheciospongiae TaxID=909613 RepID=UPI000D719851|nr:adenylate/guanylate cyclase domain-containing protein [Actinokineospora spheciospongiae]PWW54835.1 adenylate cyclase [Actinokineospora spheciospongiae]
MVERGRPGTAAPFGSKLLGPAGQHGLALRIRVQSLLTITLVTANVIGAAVVVVLSGVVIPGPDMTGRTLLAMAIAVPAYVLAALVVGAVWGTGRALRQLRWAIDQREPTAADRHATIRVPLGLTLMQAALWGAATVLFTLLVAFLQPELVFAVGFTVAFAGIVVCANAYLLSEFALRPVSARALQDDPPQRVVGAGVQVRMLLFWCLGTGVPVAGVVMVALFAMVRGNVTTNQLAVTVVVLGGVVLVFGLLVMIFNARATIAPIDSVRDGLARVQRGDLDSEIPVYDGTELGLLQAGFNRMAAGLRERERIRDLFGRHVGQKVAEAAVAAGVERLGGEVREVAVIFVDIVGSTTLAATRPPTEVVDLLNRFFAVVVDEIDAHGGLVNKFVGDAALAIFGAPVDLPDHAGRALAAARAIAARLPVEVPECEAGIGVAAGPAVAGNIGDARRFEYTVIGDPVNEAARLTELAKSFPGKLVASAHTLAAASPEEAERWRAADTVTLRGRTQETTVVIPVDAADAPTDPAEAAGSDPVASLDDPIGQP